MNNSKWIMSEGGALIAVEQQLQSCWGGVCRLTIPALGAESDYERCPEHPDFIQAIDLQHGRGLIFGEGPLDTTFWQDSHSQIFVIRTIYCDPDFDADREMRNIDQAIFQSPVEKMHFSFSSSKIVMFDSADDGTYPDISLIEANINPGRYRIVTNLYKPNERTSLIIHKFDMLGNAE